MVANTSGRPSARCCSNTDWANGCTIATSRSAAPSAAASTDARDLPRANPTACRASAIDGSVSPTVLNSENRKRSPGIVRLTRPAERIASLNTSPLAPRSRVRSRSKNAAPFIAGTPRSHGKIGRSHGRVVAPASHRKTGNAPMGDRGVSTWEAHRWGTDWWASLRAEDGGSSRVVLVCESMHVFGCIWQVEPNDTKHLFFRWCGYDPAMWTFASSPPSSPSLITARSRRRRGRSTPSSPTSPVTSPSSSASSVSRSSTVPTAA